MKGLLLPVVPRAMDGEDKTGNPPRIESVMYLLHKYGHLLGDTVVCFEEDPDMVEAILKYTDKKVVPTLVMDLDEKDRGTLPGVYNKEWVKWVLDNQDRFAGVTVGNIVVEVTNHYHRHIPTEVIIYQLFNKYRKLIGKMVLAPWHYDLIRDMETPQFPVKQALQEAGPWFTVYWGYELVNNPPPNMQEWIKDLTIYSGINYSTGALEHNLKKSLRAGMSGCLFFLPAHSERKRADQLMRRYLTDVKEDGTCDL